MGRYRVGAQCPSGAAAPGPQRAPPAIRATATLAEARSISAHAQTAIGSRLVRSQVRRCRGDVRLSSARRAAAGARSIRPLRHER